LDQEEATKVLYPDFVWPSFFKTQGYYNLLKVNKKGGEL
jgi:hypothetical protein